MRKIFKNVNGEMRSGWKILLVFAAFLGTQMISGIFLGIFMLVYSLASGSLDFTNGITLDTGSNEVINFITILISEILMILSVVVVLKNIDKKNLKHIGIEFNKSAFLDLFWGLLIGAFSMTIIFLILRFTNNITIDTASTPGISIYTFTGIITFILVGIAEELFSRGYCMTVLKQTNISWVPLVISSLIFSLLHTLNPNVTFLGLLNIFLVGILFGYMFMQRKSLWMPIGYHITWNYFQGNVFGFAVSGTDPHGIIKLAHIKDNLLTGGSFGAEGGILTTIIIVAGILLVSRLKVTKTNKAVENSF